MADERDEIRARIDIVDLIGSRVALKRSGKSYLGLCPFHDDKRPSFRVSPDTGRYKCFACGEAGDAFTWVMKTQNVEFGEAIRILAERAGVTLSRGRPEAPTERARRRAMMQEALTFFQEALGRAPEAQKFCAARGLDAESIARWEIGYAPSEDGSLATRLQKAGFSLAEGKDLFLVERDSVGGYYDKFRGRVMFPIRDERGELCAFGGRVLGDGHPKYINSGDTPLYRKGRVLYGMFQARDAISASRKAVLVEGYLDVIACQVAGVNNTVASLGTALSEDHAKLLGRWCDQVTVLYDADEAGRKAAVRAAQVLEGSGLEAGVAELPAGEDPDSILRSSGPAGLLGAVSAAISPIQFQIRLLADKLGTESAEFWKEAVRVLAGAKSRLELDEQAERLAALYPGSRDRNAVRQSLREDALRFQQSGEKTAASAAPATQTGSLPTFRALEAIISRCKPSDSRFWREAVEVLARSRTRRELDAQLRWLGTRLSELGPGSRAAGDLRILAIEEMERRRPIRVRRAPSGAPPLAAARAAVQAVDAPNAQESALLGAVLSEEFRADAWPAVLRPDLWETLSGARLAEALRAAFPKAAPKGRPVDWLHQVEPEGARAALSDLELSSGEAFVTEAVVRDAMAELERRNSARAVEALRQGDLSLEDRMEIQRRLRERIPGSAEAPL